MTLTIANFCFESGVACVLRARQVGACAFAITTAFPTMWFSFRSHSNETSWTQHHWQSNLTASLAETMSTCALQPRMDHRHNLMSLKLFA